jgi:hypothetical protein
LIEHTLLRGCGSDSYIEKCQKVPPDKKQYTLTGAHFNNPLVFASSSPNEAMIGDQSTAVCSLLAPLAVCGSSDEIQRQRRERYGG